MLAKFEELFSWDRFCLESVDVLVLMGLYCNELCFLRKDLSISKIGELLHQRVNAFVLIFSRSHKDNYSNRFYFI